jgi:hypothetical protein
MRLFIGYKTEIRSRWILKVNVEVGEKVKVPP